MKSLLTVFAICAVCFGVVKLAHAETVCITYPNGSTICTGDVDASCITYPGGTTVCD